MNALKMAHSRWAYLLILTQLIGTILLFNTHNAFAQLQTEFGQSLLEEPEPSETDPAELTISSHFSNTFNNHIELGLSVDPYTSGLAGQDDPQLVGIINRFGVDLNGNLPVADKLRLRLQYIPAS